MKFLRCKAIFFGLGISSSAIAQQSSELPTPIDLQAAYCMGVMSATVKSANEISANDPSLLSDENFNDQLSKERGILNRLSVYLVPRLAYLDVTAVNAAVELGKVDANRFDTCNSSCLDKSTRSEFLSCASECKGKISEKFLACHDPSFLPF